MNVMPLPESGTNVILEDPAGRILCILRDDDPAIHYPNTWGLVCGGCEPDETLLQCGIREVEEEVGIAVDLELVDIISSRLSASAGVSFGRAHGLLTASQVGGIVFGREGEKSEGQRYGFFTPNEIAVMDFVPQHQEFVLAFYGIANRVTALERTA